MSITDVARDWAAHDPAPETAAYVLDILEDPARAAELQSRFSGPLTFGTAGLRGEVGAGESRMNRAVVTRATYGLMDWLGRPAWLLVAMPAMAPATSIPPPPRSFPQLEAPRSFFRPAYRRPSPPSPSARFMPTPGS